MARKAVKIDVLIIGAGAAGLFCAARAGARGRSVLVIDHSEKPAEKVRISGGGRCNFTNINTKPENFLSANRHFAKSALARYTPQDFLALLARHQISWHDKGAGQLFCDGRSEQIIRMLLDDAQGAGASLALGEGVTALTHGVDGFRVTTGRLDIAAGSVVIASGGLSIPKIGASKFAYDVARQFGHEIIPTRPALVPLTFSEPMKSAFAGLAGVSLPVSVAEGGARFKEAMLFTHRGLSGPAILQISSYWREGNPIEIDLLAGDDVAAELRARKSESKNRTIGAALDDRLPKRFAEFAASDGPLKNVDRQTRLAETPDRKIDEAVSALRHWRLTPTGTEGYRTAEVTAGGVDTKGLSSKTMESANMPGLYFIGECVDVTGWLGGYNFQWAWASAVAAGDAV